MTIKKSQGHSLKHVGVYLPTPVFSYGQLYIILITDEDTNVTSNVLYEEVFCNL
ncbi:PIF1 helicase [Medicago truncatula]|uniref:PIF1 helicase n=1 Tax=Medicago truncatula TaxID=3880 RepID=A0A072V7H4_MEDTR|nr:PIF1 helicase [Medicago truncatula]